MTQWPDEFLAYSIPSFDSISIAAKNVLPNLANSCFRGLPIAFDATVAWIAEQGHEMSALEYRMNALGHELNLIAEGEVDSLMLWACAAALAKNPSLQSWMNVRELQSHSIQLQYGLSDAMQIYASHYDVGKAYIDLAVQVFEQLDSNRLVAKFEQAEVDRQRLLADWNGHPGKLGKIWEGFPWPAECLYEDERSLFAIFSVLDRRQFIDVISRSKNPYLVHSALCAGCAENFKVWQELIEVAPEAFSKNATWNGSLTLPLLLAIAHGKLEPSWRSLFKTDASEERAITEARKSATIHCINKTIETLAARIDTVPALSRWSIWLMRKLLMRGGKDTDAVDAQGFLESQLLEAIGKALQERKTPLAAPPEAPAWEAWHYQCVLAFHARNGFTAVPDAAQFLDDWRVTMDAWPGEPGARLRGRAQSFIQRSDQDIPGKAAYLLAFSIAHSSSPVAVWHDLWKMSYPLREIVEFGGEDRSEMNASPTDNDARDLLFLVLYIGLAVFDQLVDLVQGNYLVEKNLLLSLHPQLFDAVMEMSELDNSFRQERWQPLMRHLAIRRLILECRDSLPEFENRRVAIFETKDYPAFGDYLYTVQSDVVLLTRLLLTTLRSEPDHALIRAKIREAEINLAEIIEQVRKLNAINPKKYPATVDDLAQLERLSHDC